MGKKIAILTQPLINNYGGVLQAYALQRVLKDMGHSPVTINDRKGSPYSLPKKMAVKIAKRFLNLYNNRRVFNKKKMDVVNANFTRFIKDNIECSDVIRSDKALKAHFSNVHYDAIVVGSDQVWRPRYSSNIYNFYVDFETSATRIISYAASFGVDEWEYTPAQTEKVRSLIKRFTAISVREQGGVRLCSEYLDAKAQLVLDPTLLLSKEVYLQLLKDDIHFEKRQGLYTYVLDQDENKDKITDFCSKVLQKPVFSSQPLEKLNRSSSRNVNDYVFPPIEQWIKGFYEADFVITDSFHGTVFSIIFNKPFITIANQRRGLDRFHSLLSNLGLEDRLVYSMDDIAEDKIKVLIDYDVVNTRLENLRKMSYEFLGKSI